MLAANEKERKDPPIHTAPSLGVSFLPCSWSSMLWHGYEWSIYFR